jgi:hypothetical protein
VFSFLSTSYSAPQLYSSISRTPSLSTSLTLYASAETTSRFETSAIHRLSVAMPSSSDASGSWYLRRVSTRTAGREGQGEQDAPVEQRERKVCAVPVRGERDGRHRAEVVGPVERGRVRRGVVAAEEDVDRVRRPAPEAVRERAPDPRGGRRRAQREGVPDLVQAQVALDVLGELDGVA